jgi:hypothetical protein
LFKKEGKKHLDKTAAEICERCSRNINELLKSTTGILPKLEPMLTPPVEPKQINPAQYGLDRCLHGCNPPNCPTCHGTGETKPKEVGDGMFVVPPAKTLRAIRKMNKEAEDAEQGKCKHTEKTMGDEGVICRSCGKSIED